MVRSKINLFALFVGFNLASEKFQKLRWQILKDCPGTHDLYGDVRVVGRAQKEHDENLGRVMPESLWKPTIKLFHEGHQGMVRTTARIRQKVWWPNMDK